MRKLTVALLEKRLSSLQADSLQHLKACQLCFSISEHSDAHRLARLGQLTPLMTP